MLTLIALSALALQEPPAPPAPPEIHTRMMVMGPHGPDALDKDGDGQVSRDEFAAPMNDHFGRIDSNGDGRLSREEMSSGHGMAEGSEVRVIRSGDGHATPHQFELRRSAGGPGEERTVVFVGGPAGGEHSERHVIVRGPGGHGGPHIMHAPGHAGPGGDVRFEVRTLGGEGEGRHAEMDKDSDGRISEAEFTSPLRDAFTRMDADRSGFIEEGERGGDGDVRVFTHRIETRDED